MSIDLSPAHKAAIEVAPFAYPDEIVTKIVDAAAPLIEAAVREQIERAVGEWQDEQVYDGILTRGAWSDGVRFGIEAARDIARGVQP